METELYRQIYKNEKTHWWYAVRRKLVHKIIKKYLGFGIGNLKILDIGCGAGLLTKELERYGDVLGIDPSKEAVEFTKSRGAKAELASIENYENPGAFDLITALDIIEHVQDDLTAIKKIRGFLKPGGMAIVFVPALKIFWGEQDEISRHFRRYTYRELKSKFEKEGFKTIKQSYFNFFLSPMILFVRKTFGFLNIKTGTELKLNNPFFNSLFKAVFALEYFLLPKIKFPWGISLLGIYKKL